MKEFWTTGITVKYAIGAENKLLGWVAECKFYGGYFNTNGCMEGTIRTRYLEHTITEAVDYVLDCIRTFGIKLCSEIEEMKVMEFALYRDENENYYTEELLQMIVDEAERKGWKYYVEIE